MQLKHALRTAALLSALLFIDLVAADGTSGKQAYLIPGSDWIHLLPAPPKPDSAAQQADINEVRAMQQRHPANSARGQQAIADAETSCFRFQDVLGERFKPGLLPKTTAFLQQATNEARQAIGLTKHYWMRPRPYMVDRHIVALADNDAAHRKQRNPELQNDIDNTSYPSGHATFGTLCGILLTQLLPEKHVELMDRAAAYRESRMIVGVHFRTDIDAGRSLGTALGAVMQTNPNFQNDAAAAAQELRAVLGLPAPVQPAGDK